MSLDPDALVEAARAESGLSDFGGDDYREGLEALTRSILDESRLSPEGLEGARQQLTRLLVIRLQIEAFYGEHPEVDDQEIPEPVFMIGLPRTGTTALAALLQRDPERRSLTTWESAAPLPPPEAATRDTDPRIAATQAGIDARHAELPEMRAMYDATAMGSAECFDQLAMTFKTQHFFGQYWIPGYVEWHRGCDMVPAYRYHERYLKLLQWHCGPNRWHLHSPVHMFSLPDLLAVYPDAKFLMTHRDPAPVLGSVCSLIGTLLAVSGTPRDPKDLGANQLETWQYGVTRALEFRDTIGDERVADVFFHELNADPVAAIGAAYAKLGLPLVDEAKRGMAAWAEANPPGRHGSHHYALEDYGLDPPTVHDAFRFYIDRFDIPVRS